MRTGSLVFSRAARVRSSARLRRRPQLRSYEPQALGQLPPNGCADSGRVPWSVSRYLRLNSLTQFGTNITPASRSRLDFRPHAGYAIRPAIMSLNLTGYVHFLSAGLLQGLLS